MGKYGEPWRAEQDWCVDIYDRNSNLMGQFVYPNRVAQANRAVVCINACAGLSDAALESDVIAVVREALANIAGMPDEENEWDAVEKYHETRAAARATLALLGEGG